MDVYVLDKDLKIIGIADAYQSLIWANRYRELGDCELYVPATTAALDLFRKDRYLILESGSDMVCRIEKLELDTDAENGNYLTITGKDVKGFCDQRVVWDTISIDGNLETAIRFMVNNALGQTTDADRQLQKASGGRLFYLGTAAGFSEVATEQISYKNIGEKIREYCQTFGWGYKVFLQNEALYFTLYAGQDRSNSVVFSSEYENLASTKYIDDNTNLGNVALIAGEGEGTARKRTVAGGGASTERHEIYVDAKDISATITYGDLTAAYPNGTISQSGGVYQYVLSTLDIQIIDANQLAELQTAYPSGFIVTVSGVEYYRISNVAIAEVPSASPSNTENVRLYDVIYTTYLLSRGYEKLADFGEKTSFEGSVEPNTTFIYNQDYFLGDIVRIENDYGIVATARITEIVEVWNPNGYSLEPKFEYITVGEVPDVRLVTEDSKGLLAENGKKILAVRNTQDSDSVAISELTEALALNNSDVFPVVTGGATKKVSLQTLKDSMPSGASSYNDLTNKPTIGGTTVQGDKTLADYGLDLSGKQDVLTDGDGITILNNVISADLSVHTANANLTTSGWSNKIQTVTVAGLQASDTVIVAPAPSYFTAYGAAGIRCTAQGTNQLRFECNTVPTVAIMVDIVYIRGASS